MLLLFRNTSNPCFALYELTKMSVYWNCVRTLHASMVLQSENAGLICMTFSEHSTGQSKDYV